MLGRGPRRDPEKEQFWREMLRRQQAEGLSIREFCEQKSLTESAFYAWRSEIRRRDQERSTVRQRPRLAKRSRARFLPVVVADRQVASAVDAARSSVAAISVAAQSKVEIALPSGIVVRVGAGCDRRTLRAVLGAVLRSHEEAPAC